MSHGTLQINHRSNTFIKPWNGYLCCSRRVKRDNNVILTTAKPWNGNVGLALLPDHPLFHVHLLYHSEPFYGDCTCNNCAVNSSVRQDATDKILFYLPLLGESWCRSCFFYRRSWGFLARQIDWSVGGLGRWADRWHSRRALCRFLLNPGEHRASPKALTKGCKLIKKKKGLWALKFYLCTLAWCRSTPYIDSFLAFSRKFTSASAGLIPLNAKQDSVPFSYSSHKSKTPAFLIILMAFNLISGVVFSLTCSYGAAPSLSPPAHVSGWAQSGSRWRSRGRVPPARSLPVRPGRCRSPEGREWRMSRADDRTGCRPSAAGTGSTWRDTGGGNAADTALQGSGDSNARVFEWPPHWSWQKYLTSYWMDQCAQRMTLVIPLSLSTQPDYCYFVRLVYEPVLQNFQTFRLSWTEMCLVLIKKC